MYIEKNKFIVLLSGFFLFVSGITYIMVSKLTLFSPKIDMSALLSY